MCQRKKIKYDFATESTYWTTYNYTDGDVADVKRIRDVINAVVIVQKEAKEYEILEKARELNLEQLDYYYDQKWFKKMDEIQKMLLYSDFRVLPDTPVKYDGEKEDWATWRQRLRDLLPDNPREEFADNFEMFKFIQTLKNIWSIEDLKARILSTLGFILILIEELYNNSLKYYK